MKNIPSIDFTFHCSECDELKFDIKADSGQAPLFVGSGRPTLMMADRERGAKSESKGKEKGNTSTKNNFRQ